MIFKYIFFANECDLEYTGEAPMDSQILPWGGGGVNRLICVCVCVCVVCALYVVINVPTRDLLVPYTKRSFAIMLSTLAYITITMFINSLSSLYIINVCKHETSVLE